MMTEYIDLDTPLEAHRVRGTQSEPISTTLREFLDINKIPYKVADVAPVVRCKDCKHNLANIPDIQDGMNINEDWNACQLTELYDSVEPMDFCSRGARMDAKE